MGRKFFSLPASVNEVGIGYRALRAAVENGTQPGAKYQRVQPIEFVTTRAGDPIFVDEHDPQEFECTYVVNRGGRGRCLFTRD